MAFEVSSRREQSEPDQPEDVAPLSVDHAPAPPAVDNVFSLKRLYSTAGPVGFSPLGLIPGLWYWALFLPQTLAQFVLYFPSASHYEPDADKHASKARGSTSNHTHHLLSNFKNSGVDFRELKLCAAQDMLKKAREPLAYYIKNLDFTRDETQLLPPDQPIPMHEQRVISDLLLAGNNAHAIAQGEKFKYEMPLQSAFFAGIIRALNVTLDYLRDLNPDDAYVRFEYPDQTGSSIPDVLCYVNVKGGEKSCILVTELKRLIVLRNQDMIDIYKLAREGLKATKDEVGKLAFSLRDKALPFTVTKCISQVCGVLPY